MTTKYSQLANRLDELISFLEKFNEKSWSSFFRDLKKQIENENSQAVVSLTQMRGGMGSFYDLIICRINGHNIDDQNETEVNEKLMHLAENVFSLARQIRTSE